MSNTSVHMTIKEPEILDVAYVSEALISTCVEILKHISQQTQISYTILQDECMDDMLAIIQEVNPSGAESLEAILQRVQGHPLSVMLETKKIVAI